MNSGRTDNGDSEILDRQFSSQGFSLMPSPGFMIYLYSVLNQDHQGLTLWTREGSRARSKQGAEWLLMGLVVMGD